MYQLTKKIIITGTIKALSGLAIGGSNNSMSIGGVDKGVIRNPISKEPYIPGSTLKGKMRSLLELRDGTLGNKRMGQVEKGPTEEASKPAAKLFGTANGQATQRPSRIIVRDATLAEKQINEQGKAIDKATFFKNSDLPFTEVKTEVVVDRITSKAMPRMMERVPAGAQFDFEMVVNVFSGDGEETQQNLMKNVFAALQLVQNDYIGGSGSRGSGQIGITITKVVERNTEFYTENGAENNLTATYQSQFPK